MTDTHKTNTSNREEGKNTVYAPDFAELWKELYFKTESAWAEAFREFVGTKTFVKYLDTLLDQNLAGEKITRQNIDQYFENIPIVSKKDVARVAELVISLEEKIDTIEFELFDTFRSAADSLIKLVEYQEKNRDEMVKYGEKVIAFGQKVDSLTKKVDGLNKKLDNIQKKITTAKDSPTNKKSTRGKKADFETQG